MGVHVLAGKLEGYREAACLVCSTSGLAFGPLFESREEADAFLAWWGGLDLRVLSTSRLVKLVAAFRGEHDAAASAEAIKPPPLWRPRDIDPPRHSGSVPEEHYGSTCSAACSYCGRCS